jgi:prepilin-type N-terminal cleavage/methylation domain-containing protein
MTKYLTSQVFRRAKRQSGDTMIEVLAAIAIIGVALAGGYALSSHSLRTGVDASQRSTALSLAQGQVEFLKNALVTKTTGTYTSASQPFCINDATGQVLTPTDCRNHYSPYDIAITYDGATKVFRIKPSWSSLSTGDVNELSLYYKFPETFTPSSSGAPAVAGYCAQAPSVSTTGSGSLSGSIDGRNCPTLFYIAYGPTTSLGSMYGCGFQPPAYPGVDGPTSNNPPGVIETWGNSGNSYDYVGPGLILNYDKTVVGTITTLSSQYVGGGVTCSTTSRTNSTSGQTTATVNYVGGGAIFHFTSAPGGSVLNYVGNGLVISTSTSGGSTTSSIVGNGVVTSGYFSVCAANIANPSSPVCTIPEAIS